MAPDPYLKASAENTRALNEVRKALTEFSRVAAALNINLVEIGRILKENEDGNKEAEA